MGESGRGKDASNQDDGAEVPSPNEPAKPGAISWHDLTVPDAAPIRDFYSAVVGWEAEPVDMGGYADFAMTSGGSPVAGVCHARGANADLPAQWMMYITVADLDASLARARSLGGEIVAGPKASGTARYAVVRDPAGAVCALYQP
ncbi:MAG: VOC family protein [Phycisphaerales bacterium]|nr:VOC family protein [Phycisphaerales bacterium]